VFAVYGTDHYAKHASDLKTIPPNSFGDSFGYVNAWFSALAFAGVVCALLVQIAEFHLAEEERSQGLEAQTLIANQTEFAARAQMIESILSIHQRTTIEATTAWSVQELNRYLITRFRTAIDEYGLLLELRNAVGLSKNKQEGFDESKYKGAIEYSYILQDIEFFLVNIVGLLYEYAETNNGGKALEIHTRMEEFCSKPHTDIDRFKGISDDLRSLEETIQECIEKIVSNGQSSNASVPINISHFEAILYNKLTRMAVSGLRRIDNFVVYNIAS
tara:strand:+ start:829 stop:1650 length:822 start_codon:yes stop_codon:yes gene_type:complete